MESYDLKLMSQQHGDIRRMYDNLKEAMFEFIVGYEEDIYRLMDKHDMDVDLDEVCKDINQVGSDWNEINRIILKEVTNE